MKKSLALASLLVMSCATSAFAATSPDSDHVKMMVDKYIKKADTNNDGMISKEEKMAATEKMFNEADTNGDGMLSRQEMIDAKMKEMDTK